MARPSIFDLFTGIGKPEPLRYGLSGYWSRGILASIAGSTASRASLIVLTIVYCRYHYGRE